MDIFNVFVNTNELFGFKPNIMHLDNLSIKFTTNTGEQIDVSGFKRENNENYTIVELVNVNLDTRKRLFLLFLKYYQQSILNIPKDLKYIKIDMMLNLELHKTISNIIKEIYRDYKTSCSWVNYIENQLQFEELNHFLEKTKISNKTCLYDKNKCLDSVNYFYQFTFGNDGAEVLLDLTYDGDKLLTLVSPDYILKFLPELRELICHQDFLYLGKHITVDFLDKIIKKEDYLEVCLDIKSEEKCDTNRMLDILKNIHDKNPKLKFTEFKIYVDDFIL